MSEDRYGVECRKVCEYNYANENWPTNLKDKVWEMAWEYGHDSGLACVESYYQEFAGLAQMAFAA